MNHQRIVLVCGLVLPMVLCGCHGREFWLRRDQPELPPEAFSEVPSLDDVVFVVNANTDRVRQLQTETATIRAKGIPALRANLAYEQPRNFRLQAQLSQFTGRELDIGSNRDLFWFWAQRDRNPAVYFARHDQFANSYVGHLAPIEPGRLIEALGLVHLDPAGEHQLRVINESSILEISSRLPSPRGDQMRVLQVDATYGWIAQQQLYDANGQLLMSAQASKHRFYPAEGVTMPHHIAVQLMPGQPSELDLEMDISDYAVNRLYGEPGELWALPVVEGSPPVDMASPDFRPPMPNSPGDGPGSVYGPPRTARMPDYRGYESSRR